MQFRPTQSNRKENDQTKEKSYKPFPDMINFIDKTVNMYKINYIWVGGDISNNNCCSQNKTFRQFLAPQRHSDLT